jgi:hypothetical protein
MREIKFRFWDNEEKKFKPQWGFRSDVDINDMFVTLWRADIIAQQYTNLKDRNGTEIYEGDIVLGRGYGSKDDNLFEMQVVFYEGAFCLECLNSSGGEVRINAELASKLEVKGNICDGRS